MPSRNKTLQARNNASQARKNALRVPKNASQEPPREGLEIDPALLQHCNELARGCLHLLCEIQGELPTSEAQVFGQGGCPSNKTLTIPFSNLKHNVSWAWNLGHIVPGEGLFSHIDVDRRGNCTFPQYELVDSGKLIAQMFSSTSRNDLLTKSNVDGAKKQVQRSRQMHWISGMFDQKCGFTVGFLAEGLRRLGYKNIRVLSAQTKHLQLQILLNGTAGNIVEPQFYPFANGTEIVQYGADAGDLCAITDHAVLVVEDPESGADVLVDPTVYQSLPKDPNSVLTTSTPTPLVYATRLPNGWQSEEWECHPQLGNLELGTIVHREDTSCTESSSDSYIVASEIWFAEQYNGYIDVRQAFNLMQTHMDKALQRIRQGEIAPADFSLWH